MKKISFLLFVVSFCLLAVQSVFASTLTVVASEAQILDMNVLKGDLEENNVTVNFVSPADIKQAEQADYLVIVAIAGDPAWKALGDFIPQTVKNKIKEPEYGKYLFLRDIWKQNQQAVVFVAGNDEAAIQAKKKSYGNWWSTVADWFDIAVTIVHNY